MSTMKQKAAGLLVLVLALAAVIQIWITHISYGGLTSAYPEVVLVGSCAGVVFDGGILLTPKHCPVADDDVILNHDHRQVARANSQIAECSTSGLELWTLKDVDASLISYATADASELADHVPIDAVAFGPTMLSGGLFSKPRKKRHAEGQVVDANCTSCSLVPTLKASLTAARFCSGDSGGAIYTVTKSGTKLAGVIQGSAGTTTKCSETEIASILDSKTAKWIEDAGEGKMVGGCP